MSGLSESLKEYIALRRSLGTELKRPAHDLRNFVAFVEGKGVSHITTELALCWAKQNVDAQPVTWASRLSMARLFAKWHSAKDPRTEVPPEDRTLLLVAVQTGLRVSELIGLCCEDVVLGTGAHVRCQGKGRKHRSTPLRKDAVRALDGWLRERKGESKEPVFPSIRRGPLSRDAVERLVAKHATKAQRICPSLKRKKVTPHTLRHSTAMDLLHHGVDRSVIALWLGHESVETTQIYLHADLRLKEKALSRITPRGTTHGRYQPNDELLAFLESL